MMVDDDTGTVATRGTDQQDRQEQGATLASELMGDSGYNDAMATVLPPSRSSASASPSRLDAAANESDSPIDAAADDVPQRIFLYDLFSFLKKRGCVATINEQYKGR
jgi:hypothetical protein